MHRPPITTNTPKLCAQWQKHTSKRKAQPCLPSVSIIPIMVGHQAGHDTSEYYAKLKELDAYVARIIQAVKDAGILKETIFIVTSDHGGIEKGHGGKTMNEMQTPFIISGRNVKKSGEFHESMMQFDVASTIAYIFGLEQPQVWDRAGP
ncbi:MAG: alkaline phosphatase [Bacteroides cellulosilyticus]